MTWLQLFRTASQSSRECKKRQLRCRNRLQNTYAESINDIYKLEKNKLESGVNMRRSKLEMYIDILKVLAQRGPLKLTHIMYKANVNCSVLKEYLDFLIQQELVEEQIVGKKRIVYAVSEKGFNVLKYFRELKIMLPVVEEGKSRLPASLY
jgi:predicted transcriptional regulator